MKSVCVGGCSCGDFLEICAPPQLLPRRIHGLSRFFRACVVVVAPQQQTTTREHSIAKGTTALECMQNSRQLDEEGKPT